MADMMASTPSPTADANGNVNINTPATTVSNSSSNSRRPPRKSTLTQQQKNQKRQRATQDQLVLLEVEFNKNPTPTAAVRERIANEINMTERSVQIWFQNRRAKIKLLAKKSIETGEDCDSIPESYRQYLAMQAMESGKPIARNFMGSIGGYGGNMLLGGESHSPQKVVIHHFQCRSLQIGSWRRVGQNAMDLVIFYSLGDKPSLTYYINNESAGYKIEFPFSHIKNITLENPQVEGADGRHAGLLVELNRAPNFFMDNAGSGGFNQCGDFTEDQQASKIMFHHLGGDPRVLSGQLAKLSLLESFQNRHMANFMDTNVIAASAPVSPVGHRPASQPNAAAQNQMGPPDSSFGGLHPGARIHKRTRSRSVPAITDFSFLNQPMPSFHIQHPSTTITDASIFAPIPQHTGHLGPGGPLRINTAPGYGIDFGRYPMSAATNSPSEYQSPGFNYGGPGSDIDPIPSAGFQPSYNMPFMSPMQENSCSIQPSVSPLSAVSHGDPVIADQSPPLANMHRSASADFLHMPQDQNAMTDDTFSFNDMYGKPNMHLPFRPNGIDDAQFDMSLNDDPTGEELDQQMYTGTIDPSTLNAQNHGL